MNISLKWISDFVDILEKDSQKIAEVLTEKSAEIEAVHDLGKSLENVVVGEILEILPHPDADKIRITKTKISDTEILQIICGAKNIAIGQKVPVALIGAVLPGDFRIERRKMRGVESEGMLCSARELGLGDDHAGILILDESVLVGSSVAKALGKDDIVLEIENPAITNRPDLFSQVGFARELVADGLAKWKKNQFEEVQIWDFSAIEKEISKTPFPFSFEIENPEICPARGEILLENLRATESPAWIRARLENCGIRPINSVVDVSNFVMLEVGMPLHTFDADKISGNRITMRVSKEGEKVSTLDGIERTLPADVILQEDADKIFDLAGIMGGENSEIGETTTRVLVHVPVYDPIRIRRAALALNHRTDAATIYEKRVPSASVKIGLLRTLQLLRSIHPEMKIASAMELVDSFPESERILTLQKEEITRVLGRDLEDGVAAQILQSLDFEILKEAGDTFFIKVPPHRYGDISIPADLIEEIARISGLNAIAAAAPQIQMVPNFLPPMKKLRRAVSDFLVGENFFEVLNLAFLGEDLLKKCGLEKTTEMIEIQNPLGADQSLMRTKLLPRVLEVAERNRRHRESFRLFEIGKTFEKNKESAVETSRLSALFVGEDFFVAKGVLISLFEMLGATISFWEKTDACALAQNSTQICLGEKTIGSIFTLSKRVAKNFDIPESSASFSLNLDLLLNIPSTRKIHKVLPKFPGISWDFSVLAPDNAYGEGLLKALEKLDSRIESSEILEIFSGKGVPEGQKSVTIRTLFRAEDRTLTEADEKELREKILKKLKSAGFPFRF